MNHWTPTDPEVQSIEDFVQYLLDEELTVFTATDLQALNKSLNRPVRDIRAELEDWGFAMATRPKEKKVRGVTTSSHDRWYGPGSSPSHGGTGWEQISGSAGRVG